MRLPERAAPASWGTSMIRGGGRRDVIPPELLRERLLHGPDLIERRGLEELAVLHHVADGVRVLDLFQRVPIEDQHVRELSRLYPPEVGVESDGLGAVNPHPPQR